MAEKGEVKRAVEALLRGNPDITKKEARVALPQLHKNSVSNALARLRGEHPSAIASGRVQKKDIIDRPAGTKPGIQIAAEAILGTYFAGLMNREQVIEVLKALLGTK